MANFYQKDDGIECRACGAAFAQPDIHGPFCNICMKKFRYERYRNEDAPEDGNYDENDLTRWLARQLELHIVRKKKYGFAARCEALTGHDFNDNGGYQCGFYASNHVCGRYLCERHTHTKANGKRGRVLFMDEYKSPYKWLEEMIKDISKEDADFKISVMKGLGIFK